jgi:selenoprotein W-related protein
VELIGSGGGVFEVKVDGALIHSKKKTGLFPLEEEIIEAIRSRLTG